MYDLAIIGGGPAGVAAGVYAARKQLKTVLITKEFGGQSIVSEGIENWIGDIRISGLDLAKKFENHLRAYSGDFVEIKKGEIVTALEKGTGPEKGASLEKMGRNVREYNNEESKTNNEGPSSEKARGATENYFKESFFNVTTSRATYQAKSVLITAGANRRRLSAKGADQFEHKGLTYCASCDGPFFKDKNVAVVGGGNAAFETVLQLLAYTKQVYLVHRRREFRADPVTVEAAKRNPKLKILSNTEITEIIGDKMVSGFKYKNIETGEISEMAIDGIFIEIGAVAATDFLTGLVDLNGLDLADDGTIKIDPWTQRTTIEGVWAAGDITNAKYHQNNIAAGDAVRALEDIYVWVKRG